MKLLNNLSVNLVPYTYLLILHPDESVREKILEQKKLFAEKLECPSCLHSKPHITLLKFTQYNSLETRIVKRISNFAQTISPFSISLNGFGSFPSHTIYFNVQTKNEIISLVKNLRELHLPLKMDKDNKPHFITEPHITLARKLLPYQYEKGWLEWSNQNFTARFPASEMILLKRRNITSNFQLVKTFSFAGKKEQVQQGSLFSPLNPPKGEFLNHKND
ncbi:hypothetical protein A9P82_04735 [Arachidicoccus ginsenosidimutans]|uniref:2'-5' RNA ligase family protein n=1 Tax=Arachidicoccus sp. BS20 TaxID=1850526 RepID=UPI0007F06042|nr:2'-5' RNA ligase family protein [Arachidicoccus sp. BS20]ANI88653.1 hypothetical protein A9P82_04735 [Arachidicoccus sp. BS20]